MNAGGPATRIAIVLPDLSGGGAERMRLNLAHDWLSRGYHVELVLLRERGALRDLVDPRISVIDLGVTRIRHAVAALRTYLVEKRPDATLAAMWPLTSAAIMAWLLAGRPGRVFVSDHNQLSMSSKGLGVPPLLLKLVLGATYPFANGLIAISEGVRVDICRIGGLRESRVTVIYNPAATGAAATRSTQAERQQLWGAGFRFHVLTVGNLKQVKDHVTLVRAFAQLPQELNAKLTILGEGELRSELEALVRELGLEGRVALPGFHQDPYPWFRSADLFVLTSLWEGFGNVLVESLECGVPIVSTDCPTGPREILADGVFGDLVPMRNPTELARAIHAALLRPHRSGPLIERAREFSVSRIADRYLDLMLPGWRESHARQGAPPP